ncbi:MAG: peptide ABC transporter substrate-binding protein [Candidatus Pacebacteria bacterium]|nr:peptide ABC transporter substrate-binding protein [Candidatus Paceibacterota bacterium]
MNKLLHYLLEKEWKIPQEEKISRAIRNFSLFEKILLYCFVAIFLLSALTLLNEVSNSVSVEIPAHGGTLTEGVIGTPRFINPLLATSDTDRDLVSLVYSGLLKETSDGQFIPDLAESYTISPDGLVYTFQLKKDIVFQDGTPITADDVVFTIQKAQSPTLKSPKRANWDGVKAEKVNDQEIKLTLKQAYGPFLENTTLGILPKHIWKDTTDEAFPFNSDTVKPVGSGPYQIDSIEKDKANVPISYTLSSFRKYAGGEAYISQIIFKFYQNEDDLLSAYKSKEIESVNTISPEKVSDLKTLGGKIEQTPLSRIFGVFFNQNEAPIFAAKEVRTALNMAVDKDKIVHDVLLGFGVKLNGPIPPGSLQNEIGDVISTSTPQINNGADIDGANALLENAGWKINPDTHIREKKDKKNTQVLSFSLAVPNTPELKRTADILKGEWAQIGVEALIKVYEPGDLSLEVIRPRKYDALLFGEIVGPGLDLFAFWHSSQRNDPGLNIALYTNVKVDKILEQIRILSDDSQKIDLYRQFEGELAKDTPAIFLYAPDFIYVVPAKVQGFSMGEVTVPSDRFLTISNWFIDTDKVWKIFVKK